MHIVLEMFIVPTVYDSCLEPLKICFHYSHCQFVKVRQACLKYTRIFKTMEMIS